MGDIHPPNPALLLVAVCSRYDAALAWAKAELAARYGLARLASPAFDFVETDYYQATMGADLKKQFLAFERLIDPSALPVIKRETNQLEAAYAAAAAHAEPRPLNLDPGYLTLAKLVLASTKDHSHRIYLGDGVFAEVTLNYRNRGWQPCDWTYPDYRRHDFQAFFTECRHLLRGLS